MFEESDEKGLFFQLDESLKSVKKHDHDRLFLILQSYARKFTQGQRAYELENYSEAVSIFEDSLADYFRTEDDCRAFCEGEFDHGGSFPDFITSVGSKKFDLVFCVCLCADGTITNLFSQIISHLICIASKIVHVSWLRLGVKATQALWRAFWNICNWRTTRPVK